MWLAQLPFDGIPSRGYLRDVGAERIVPKSEFLLTLERRQQEWAQAEEFRKVQEKAQREARWAEMDARAGKTQPTEPSNVSPIRRK